MIFKVDNPYRLAASMIAVIALTVLMLTETVEPHEGLPPLLYVIGYSVGGTFGPTIRKGNPP